MVWDQCLLYSWSLKILSGNINNCPTRCDYMQFCYISADSSTCFWWYPHPSSGGHSNCNYNIWHWSNCTAVWPVPDVVITVCVCSWWWMTVSSKTCRAVCRNIIELYIVACCLIIIDTDSRIIFYLAKTTIQQVTVISVHTH